MKPCIISTERLCLRRWIDSDSASFIKMNSDPQVMKYFPQLSTSAETMAMINRINLAFDINGFGLWAVENKITKEFLGFTGFMIPQFESFFTPCVEIGWRLKKESWGQGFATEAAKACLDYGFNKLGFNKIVSFTSSVNLKSEKVMQRIGMSYVVNFDHPKIEKENKLCRHVLYEITIGK
ncbi:MAG: GNAT family N-acetyltransferase [Ginsengibacter sp.]